MQLDLPPRPRPSPRPRLGASVSSGEQLPRRPEWTPDSWVKIAVQLQGRHLSLSGPLVPRF